jgi:hypothetical protein
MNPNPLSEANPKSLDEIFSGDPSLWATDGPEVRTIVAELRAQAARWAIAEAAGKTRVSSPKLKEPAPKLENISLDDLEL